MCADERGNRRQDVEAAVLTYAASCLWGIRKDHKFLFLWGRGSNGKSVFLDVLDHILGDLSAAPDKSLFERRRWDKKLFHLGTLEGARLAVIDETNRGSVFDEALITKITGSKRVQAELKGGRFWYYVPQVKLIFAGNHLPQFRDDAMGRRIFVLKLRHQVRGKDIDDKLYPKLKKEAPQILFQLLVYSQYWWKYGLFVSETIIKDTEQNSSGAGTAAGFAREFLVDRLPALKQSVSVSYADFNEEVTWWRKHQGLGYDEIRECSPKKILKAILSGGYGAKLYKRPWTLDVSDVVLKDEEETTSLVGEPHRLEVLSSFVEAATPLVTRLVIAEDDEIDEDRAPDVTVGDDVRNKNKQEHISTYETGHIYTHIGEVDSTALLTQNHHQTLHSASELLNFQSHTSDH